MDSLVAQMVKNLLAMQETQVQSLSWKDPLEKVIAAHSSTLAWRIPWTEDLQYFGHLMQRADSLEKPLIPTHWKSP